jgi:hypothetical protein
MAAHDDANRNTVDRMFVGLCPRRGGAMRQRVGTNVLELFAVGADRDQTSRGCRHTEISKPRPPQRDARHGVSQVVDVHLCLWAKCRPDSSEGARAIESSSVSMHIQQPTLP